MKRAASLPAIVTGAAIWLWSNHANAYIAILVTGGAVVLWVTLYVATRRVPAQKDS